MIKIRMKFYTDIRYNVVKFGSSNCLKELKNEFYSMKKHGFLLKWAD